MKYGKLAMCLLFGGALILGAGLGVRELLSMLVAQGVKMPRSLYVVVQMGTIAGAVSIASRICVNEIKRLRGDGS
jgi:hypothetical protein